MQIIALYQHKQFLMKRRLKTSEKSKDELIRVMKNAHVSPLDVDKKNNNITCNLNVMSMSKHMDCNCQSVTAVQIFKGPGHTRIYYCKTSVLLIETEIQPYSNYNLPPFSLLSDQMH